MMRPEKSTRCGEWAQENKMPTYDLDADNTLFEPLKLKVDGIELVIPDVDRKEFDRITDIRDPYDQLAQWAKVKVSVVEKILMKKVAATLKIIGKEFLGPAVGSFIPKKD